MGCEAIAGLSGIDHADRAKPPGDIGRGFETGEAASNDNRIKQHVHSPGERRRRTSSNDETRR
jgi:hypothetical protein